MSNAPTPPPDVLRALLRFPFDAVAANKVLNRPDVYRWIAAIAGSIWRKDRVFRGTFAEEDFAVELIGGLWLKLTQLRSQPDDRDPAAYLAGILRNLAKDEWRRRSALKRGSGQADAEFDESKDKREDVGALRGIIVRDRLKRVVEIARQAGTTTPLRRATFIAMLKPEALAPTEVAGAGKSFVRGADTTMGLIKRDLRDAVPPAMDGAAERTFVWIARCALTEDDAPGWDAWVARQPEATRTALDTVQENFNRAKKDILKAMNAEGGEA